MNFDCVHICFEAISFFEKENFSSLKVANAILNKKTGIVDFFENDDDFVQFQQTLKINQNIVAESRAEYGDFQTNKQLAKSICDLLKNRNLNPQILLEPTCGKGSFILSAIKTFPSLQQIFAIEIQEKYLWHLKFELLEYFLKNPNANKPQINLYHCSVFDFDFKQVKNQINNRELLVIGNPPWVTNSTLSTLNSTNLPKKSNFKKTKGIDAITGKGNFDIGEFISLKMLGLFSNENGYFTFLIKNSVIKNIVFEQKKNKYPISDIEKHTINAKKEFGAAVDASLFLCKFNSMPEFTAQEFDFYTSKHNATFGVGDYSFKPYKVAISGLYKQTKFTLVKPNGTVLLLDDTCYFIGFETLEEAQIIQNLLNQSETQEFIESFMFTDAKRAITKDLLMRIDFANHSISLKNKQLKLFEI